METLFYLIVLAIYGAIILANTYGVWRVYQIPYNEQPGFTALGKGAMAGFSGSFWLCFISAMCSWNSNGGLIFIMWFFGLMIFPVIGMILTGIYFGIISKLKLEIGFWSRAFLGLIFAVFIGLVVGIFLNYINPNYEGRSIPIMIFVFAPIGVASGIMAGEPQLNDYPETERSIF